MLLINHYRADKSVDESAFMDKCNEVEPVLKQNMLAKSLFSSLDGRTTKADSDKGLHRIKNEIQTVGKIPAHPLYPTRYIIAETPDDDILLKPVFAFLTNVGFTGTEAPRNPKFYEAGLVQLNFQLKSGYEESARFELKHNFPNMDIALSDFKPAQYDYEFVLTQ